ncbi:GNAT family N-acetyltransferase [Streptomyces sp. SBT349]|uniref:GNAT family N-acetyltransferase n=1 Tax=Streptomyces sp. SBT349 TaxID=1580539 RepID=UPI00066CFC48|nr:GNAT family N-acetyltransferase [Streptomyces sp. SBT349]
MDSASVPVPPGFAFRPYRGETDHPHILRVRLACRDGGGGIDPRSVVEPLPTSRAVADAAAAPGDPHRDQVLVEHEGSVAGYATITSWRDQDGTEVHLHRGWLLPALRGRGAGTAMVRWAEERIAALARAHGTVDRACFAANAADVEPESVALLTDLGYRRVFSVTEFERAGLGDLPPLPGELPGGARLRPAEESHYRPVWEMVREAYADTGNVGGWDFEEFARRAEPAHWQVAWDGSEVVGAALCVAGGGVAGAGDAGPDGGPVGEVRELSVRKDRRRRGLGRALLISGLHALARHGAGGVRLFTGSANPYRSYELYQSAGFRRVAEFGRYRKPFGD